MHLTFTDPHHDAPTFMSMDANCRPGNAACWRRSDNFSYLRWSFLFSNSHWLSQYVALCWVFVMHYTLRRLGGPWFNSRQAQQIFSFRKYPDGLCGSPSPLICAFVRKIFLFFFILLLFFYLLLCCFLVLFSCVVSVFVVFLLIILCLFCN